MKSTQINFRSMELGYKVASKLAAYFAHREFGVRNPAIVAWRDRASSQRFPAEIEGCPDPARWHIYGETHGGELEVGINGEFDFIIADSADFEPYGPSPYVSRRDASGAEFLCRADVPRDPRSLGKAGCAPLDEWTSKLT